MMLVALLGAVVGSFVNWGIYSLAWFQPRAISPWSRPPENIHRQWFDYLPIIGWLGLRREAVVFGAGHWIRPLLIELGMALGLAWLYQHELSGALLPASPLIVISVELIHAQFAAHFLLIVLMMIATFIDFDEQTIPDAITIPGALIGIGFIACFPFALPQVVFNDGIGLPAIESLWFTSAPIVPKLPVWFEGVQGLVMGLSCFVAWCYVLVPKTCTLKRGLWKGWLYLHASTFRGSAWWKMGLVALCGSAVIAAVWQRGGSHWHGLLTSLVGLAFGGGMIWAVRIVGYVALHKEAMGFGDVTLMCVIGAFLGWQASIMVFFLAPLAAVVIAVAQTLLTGRRDIAFGPYLCAGALLLILGWPWFWNNYGDHVFSLGWLVPALLLGGLLFMMGLLMLWRIVEQALVGERS